MQLGQSRLVPYHAEELLKKCKYKEDIVNICREMGNFFGYYLKNLVLMDIIFCNGLQIKKSK